MGMREFFRPTTEAVRPGEVFASWVQGLVLTAILTAIAFLNEAGPLRIALVIVNVGFLSFLVLHKVSNRGAARLLVAVIGVIGLGILGWSVWNKHQAAQEYTLSIGNRSILRDGRTLPSGENQVTSIQPVLDVGNENDFPLYFKIVRRFAKFEEKATPLDNPLGKVDDILPGHGVYIETYPIDAVLDNAEPYEVQVEYQILYGRTPQLGKRVTYTANWQFFLCPMSAYLCGDVTATNETRTDEWVRD